MADDISKREKFAIVAGVTMLFAGFITFFLTFISAYAVPSKTVLVTINNYNEAIPELILVTISLILGLYAIGTLISKL